MATATEKPDAPLSVPLWREDEERASKSERYLAKRLRAAAADHRSVAWSTFLVGSGIGLLAWLFVGVFAEHWLVVGGLPAWARVGWLLAAVAGLVAGAMRWLLPLLKYRVNLVYAARTIEQGHPDLHNDLVNTVLLQEHSQGIPETVTHSLRRRTARGLARQPGDLVADRSQLLQMVYVLAALVVAACLYQVVSPKNLLVSAARLAAPWSRIMPPTRVRIAPAEFAWRVPPREGRAGDVMRHPLEVQGGQVTLHRGRQLIVSTTIRGRRRGEQPQVAVVPLLENGKPDIASAWSVDMVRRAGGVAEGEPAGTTEPEQPSSRREVYEAVLPGGDRGMDRSVECRIIAGDGQTEAVRIAVVDVPQLLVREVRYEFPDYTKRPPETVQWQGDLRALEGTRATLVAEASLPLSKAWIDFGCDGRHDWELSIPQHERVTARASFPLRLNETRTGPWFDSYQLQMQLADAAPGDVLTEEVRHRIEVIADLPPEVRVVKPVDQLVRIPPGAPAPVEIAARDPDFAIARTGLEYRVLAGDQTVADGFLWQPEAEHQGPLTKTLTLTPADIGAVAGQRIAYRAVVEDNRQPKPNRGVSHKNNEPWPEFAVDASAEPQPLPPPPAAANDRQPAENEQSDDAAGAAPEQGDDRAAADGANDDSQDGGNEDQPGQENGPQEGENNGQQDAGEDAGAEQPQEGEDGQQSTGGDSGESGEGPQGASGEGGEPSPNGAGQEGAAGQAAEGRPQEGQQGSGQPGEGAAPGETEGNADGGGAGERENAAESRQRPGGDGERGEDEGQPVASDGSEDGEAMERILEHRRQAEQQGEGQQGPSENTAQQGEGQQGEGQQGPSENTAQQGEGQQGEGQQGEGQQGEGQQGEGQQGEGQQGEGQQGEGQQGEGQQGESENAAQQGGTQAGQAAGGAGQQEGEAGELGESGDTRGMAGQGSWSNGEGERRGGDTEPTSSELEWGREDLDHARNATDLAIEHLRDRLEQGDRDLLEQLGWSEAQARAFLARWDAMQRLQQSEDPADRLEFERAVRSLGLRPEGVRTQRRATREGRNGEAEGTRSRPPSEYLERVRAYTEGLSTE